MSAWEWASLGFTISLLSCAYLCFFKKDPIDRLIGFQMAGAIEGLLLIALAEAMKRPSFFDIGLTMALLSFGGGFVFVRFLERWE